MLFYAVLAVLLWPSGGSDTPFVAARSVGVAAAKAIWVVVWGLLALLAVVGSGRSPQALHDLVAALLRAARMAGPHRSLHRIAAPPSRNERLPSCWPWSASSWRSASTCRRRFTKVTLVLGMVTFAIIWVATQNFGGILAGGATDPNSGPLVIILALIYWPLTSSGTPRQAGLQT